MLRVGHKYAYKPDLRRTLSRLVQETDEKMGRHITQSGGGAAANWHKWKHTMITKIVTLDDPPKPIEMRLRRGTIDLKNMDVILKQADKNMGLVPIRGDIYNAELRKWLAEPAFQRVPIFPHQQIMDKLRAIIAPSRLISRQQKNAWMSHASDNNEPCPFYAIPKIHKPKFGSRPITAQHSYMLAPVSKHLAQGLQRIVANIPTIARDSKAVVQRLEQLRLPTKIVFLTFDVEACYPSIDLDDAIKTLHDNLPYLQHEDGIMCKLLHLVMHNNYVKARGEVYHQKIGTATGTQVAPPFANLYLHYKFKTAIENSTIYFYDRFIDDALVITSTKEEATRLMATLQTSSNLNLTYDISQQEGTYLDLTVYKGTRYKYERRIDIKVYFKPSNKLLYLPYISNHPRAMKEAIVRGEAIRLLRNTSDKGTWLQALGHIFKGLMARGYPPGAIKSKWRTVIFEDRLKYINTWTTKRRPKGIMIFTNYNPLTKPWWKILLAQNPITDVLHKRHNMWNRQQGFIINDWPPIIVWKDFKKIAHSTINAQDSWTYKPKRRREPGDDGPTPKRLRNIQGTNNNLIRPL